MKDIPLFQAAGGLASLFLSEVPVRQAAWVKLQSWSPDRLGQMLSECRTALRLCRAKQAWVCAGAEVLPGLEHAYDLLELTCPRPAGAVPAADMTLEPLTPGKAQVYLDCYQCIFAGLIHAKTHTPEMVSALAASGRGYLAYRGGQVCGIGEVLGSEVRTIGLVPECQGCGLSKPLLGLLMHQTQGDIVTVCVTSENAAALALYQSQGFQTPTVTERWYRLY